MKAILIFLLTLYIFVSFSLAQDAAGKNTTIPHEQNKDLLKLTEIETKLSQLAREIEVIDKTQLNYKIEKDLIREAYSNSYKTINTVVSFSLGIIAILGFLGIKDIGRIKEKYEDELKTLSELKLDFERRTKAVEEDADKLDSAISELIRENQEQDKKIKFIELKDRMMALQKEGNNVQALEFANLALELQPEDELCINVKSTLLVRLNQLPQANKLLLDWLEKHPESDGSRVNLVEQLYFAGNFELADKLIQEKQSAFTGSQLNGKLLEFLGLFKLYHEGKTDELKQIISSAVTHENLKYRYMDNSWSFKEALHFIHYRPDSEPKRLLNQFLFYLDNQLSGEELLNRLNIELPKPPTDQPPSTEQS